jgi:hypothetical protein
MSAKFIVIVFGCATALAGCGVNAGVGGRGAHVGGWLGQNTTGAQRFVDQAIIQPGAISGDSFLRVRRDNSFDIASI